MVSTEVARTTVGIIGNVIAFIMFLSPVPTFIRIVKNGTVEQFLPYPYLAKFINCGLWVLYGLPMVHPHSFLVLTINGAGFLIASVYLLLFLLYSDRQQRLKVMSYILAEIFSLGVLTGLTLTYAHTTKFWSNLVGCCATVANIMMYAAPLCVMKQVISTKSVEYMPFLPSLFSLLNGISWTVYALIGFDIYIVIPSGIGSLLGLTQLALYATFYKSTNQQSTESKEVA
ncbi:bidirectional sugar transporter SWEET4-like [Rutidosis leptorrhynchoides]|uniref:bidirectional sugar transporter SWEET4-like n=1 Tax=Rutidosis leptorrhynchoides TaxID=125765 RepID=UPI003A9A36EB